MKKQVLIIALVLIQSVVYSQNIFNRIIEDTVAHITNSVCVIDTGYVILTGTQNEHNIRSCAFTYIDNTGQKQWKKIYGSSENEFWEGKNNNLKTTTSINLFTGQTYQLSSGYYGIHLSMFNQLFDLTYQNIFLLDSVQKKSLNTVVSEDGFVYSTGQIYNYDHEEYFTFLMKTNVTGTFFWIKTYFTYFHAGLQIVETQSKDMLIGGICIPTSITKWYLLKTDTAGNVIWERAYGHNNFRNGAVNGLIETVDSCYLACGSYPVAKYGTGSGEILWDGCLRKISCDGDLLWTKYLRSYLLSHTGDIYFQNNIYSIVEKNENIYAVGWNYGYVSWKDRGYLTKLDKEGNLLWKREYYALDTNTYSQYLTVLQPTNDNGFILAGYGNEYSTHGYDPPQQSWLVKTDSMGLDGLSNVELPDLNIDLDLPESVCIGDTISVYAYISGKSAPYTIEISNGQFIDSIYYPPTFVPVEIGLTHVDLEWGGSTYFQQTITEATLTNHEWGQCIAKPVDFYTPLVAGTTELHITVVDAYGESKTITKEVNVVDCGVEIAKIEVCPVKLYPNPVKDKVYVDIPKEITPNNAEIFNSLGQLVKIVNVHKGLNIINVADFTSGNYILKISANNENFSLSFEKK